MSEKWVVRQASRCGVGLDPVSNRKYGPFKVQVPYLSGFYFYRGPEHANHYESREEAEAANEKYGSDEAFGSETYGHIWPSEVVTLSQAMADEINPPERAP